MINNLASKLPDTIETDRLTLRAPNMADAPALHQLANDKYIHDMLARLPHPYTRAHAVDFITNLARTKDEHAYAIVTENDNFIGVIGWHLTRELGMELGYWIGKPHWGKGYASEVAIALVQAAGNAGYQELFANAKTDNLASIRVLQKAGFTETSSEIGDCGVHRGIHMSVFKWEPKRGASHG